MQIAGEQLLSEFSEDLSVICPGINASDMQLRLEIGRAHV